MSRIVAVCVAIAVLASLGITVTADAVERLAQYVIASGGGESSGGGLRVTGTIGQYAVDVLAGGGFVLRGGFWQGGAEPTPPTATPTNTVTASRTPTGTVTASATATPTPTSTATATGTVTAARTPTITVTASATATKTVTATPRPTGTLVPTGRLYLPLVLRRR
jgi:hypothetical protein